MASSFAEQIPVVLHVLAHLSPRTVLDVGKGFGKYGFLIHEYVGVDTKKRPDPGLTLAEQSCVTIDAIECNPDYLWPHLKQFYRTVTLGRIEDLCLGLPAYDVVLMTDVIEHLEKSVAEGVLASFFKRGSTIVVSTPTRFLQQDLYQSADERHRSFWGPQDFWAPNRTVYHQHVGPGTVYVMKMGHLPRIRGFGNDPVTRARRVARLSAAELGFR